MVEGEGRVKGDLCVMFPDLEPDLLVNPNMTLTSTSGVSTVGIKQEPLDVVACSSAHTASPALTFTRTSTHSQTLLKQPTIILATQHAATHSATQHHSGNTISMATSMVTTPSSMLPSVMHIKNEPIVLPRVNIKVEPVGSPTPYQMTATHSSLPSPDSASTASSPEHHSKSQ